MKLSTKGRYGLRAMFELALNYEKGPISLHSISKRQDISLNYLEQLFSQLKKAGLVKSVRGKQGGYFIEKEPKEIFVGEILAILEGELAPTECVKDLSKDDNCSYADYCVTRTIYNEIKKSIHDVVYSINLQDMLDEHYENVLTDIDTSKCYC
ncbi:RrF2 family transcriptional regulator [Helicovermis profundi]|uniref:Rrf2 family transcriptional regulator n=1 Tax=Helicovermis profundi TaxID=3065157 RepID=A0AAU9ER45_9FIRM|nr:Rrf2 family transcriptional regulator [Clostridia bacterium S502]